MRIKIRKSLLLLSFPRSMSNLTYEVCKVALNSDLTYPQYGEGFLNPNCNKEIKKVPYYSKINRDFRFLRRILEKHLNKYGSCILKDVTQPFFIQKWFKGNSDRINTIFINRPIADIVYCNWKKGWYYISKGRPSNKIEKEIDSMVEGAMIVYNNFYSKIKNNLEFDRLISEEKYLFDILESLDYRVNRYHYFRSFDGFMERRDKVLAYREDQLWKEIKDKVDNFKMPTYTEEDYRRGNHRNKMII